MSLAIDPSLDVVPEGWWALGDAAAFYPEDLPDDWRLAYFANQFRAVLVPRAAWQAQPALDCAAWRSDVHTGFRFFLECQPAIDSQSMTLAANALGPALGAFVVAPNPGLFTAPLAPPLREPLWEPATKPAPQTTLATRLLAAGADQDLGLALHCPSQLNADPRGARAWLNGFKEKPRLVILDRPTASDLEAWSNLVILLGLG